MNVIINLYNLIFNSINVEKMFFKIPEKFHNQLSWAGISLLQCTVSIPTAVCVFRVMSGPLCLRIALWPSRGHQCK